MPDKQIQETAERLVGNVETVIVGKGEVVRLMVVALLAEGHVLIDDIPGIGKTTLAKAVAKSIGCTFRRVQFTPDLLPSDVTGIYYFNQKSSQFELKPGPVMANIVLADEINRATPRAQSCLLECMQERQVTIDGETLPLPRPFLVIATQNPIEMEGTFPLPEAQIDRFLLRLKLGYPSKSQERDILLRFMEDDPLEYLEKVVEVGELREMQQLCHRVFVEESVLAYIVDIGRATRNHPGVRLGASPRATLGLRIASQAWAAIQGRDFVIPDDIKHLAVPVLSHRLVLDLQAHLRGRSSEDIVRDIVDSVPVPVEESQH
ncbi:MAG: MoxR family ATPase [Chloroflexota bacterium]|nr:MoxR family ATPase [Chloroflexota bacterium]